MHVAHVSGHEGLAASIYRAELRRYLLTLRLAVRVAVQSKAASVGCAHAALDGVTLATDRAEAGVEQRPAVLGVAVSLEHQVVRVAEAQRTVFTLAVFERAKVHGVSPCRWVQEMPTATGINPSVGTHPRQDERYLVWLQLVPAMRVVVREEVARFAIVEPVLFFAFSSSEL